jgi:hypothetical protein
MGLGKMPTENDIQDQRDKDVQLLDDKISAAIVVKNGLPINDPRRLQLSDTINHLMDCRTDLHIQELKSGLASSQLSAALAKIVAASHELDTEAAKMKNVTSYIGNANAVIGTVTKVVNVLKNGG